MEKKFGPVKWTLYNYIKLSHLNSTSFDTLISEKNMDGYSGLKVKCQLCSYLVAYSHCFIRFNI